jgi:hypothetical protein
MKIMYFLAQVVEDDLPGLPKTPFSETTIPNAMKIVFGFAGGIALLIVTLAGFKYVLSQGNPAETAKAKNTIIGALIGLVVCMTAYSIVVFVVSRV